MKKNELKKWRENYTPFTGVCLGEGMKLNVHFDEKDFVKDLGARWHPDPSPNQYSHGKGGYWWMPVRQLTRQPDADMPSVVNTFEVGESDTGGTSNGITVLQWLNDNKMLTDEIHGDLRNEECNAAVLNETGDTYTLGVDQTRQSGWSSMSFTFFEDLGIVKMTTIQPHGRNNTNHPTRESSNWSTVDNARALWDSLVENGSKRINEEIAV